MTETHPASAHAAASDAPPPTVAFRPTHAVVIGGLSSLSITAFDLAWVGAMTTNSLGSVRFYLEEVLVWWLLGVLAVGLVQGGSSAVRAAERALGRSGDGWRWELLRGAALAALPTLAFGPALVGLFSGPTVARTSLGTYGPALSVLLLYLGSACWILLLRRGLARAPWRRPASALFLVGALLLAALDKRLLPGLYTSFHDVTVALAFSALLSGWSLVVWGARPRPQQNRVSPLLVALLAAAGLVAAARYGLANAADRAFAWRTQASVERIARNVRAVVDLDGDGVSAFFGGGDCDDLAPEISPNGFDVPENGVDEDCDGVDLTVAEIRSASRAWVPPRPDPERWGPAARKAAHVLRTGNVLVVSIDALRLDRAIGPDGSILLPSLRRLAEHTVAFTHAYAPATSTRHSLPVILTSSFDRRRDVGSFARDASRHGMVTRFFSHRIIHATLSGGYPLRAQFDSLELAGTLADESDWGWGVTAMTSDELTRRLLDAWDGDGRRRKLYWIHYNDLHQWDQIETNVPNGSDAERYDWILGQIDRSLSTLLAQLEQRGELGRTVVIFTSDHGEGLGDRDIRYHTEVVYDVLARVPLLMYIPTAPPRVVNAPVSLADLRATLDALWGSPAPEGVTGEPLARALDDPSWHRETPILIVDKLQTAVVDGQDKLIVDPWSNTIELYDLARDPLEQDNIEDLHVETRRRLTLLMKLHPSLRP